MEDIKYNKDAQFVTLTFSNESIKELVTDIPNELTGYDRDNAIATLANRRFLERWRKHNGKSVRHWLVTELGHNGTENIHMHGLIWTPNKKEINKRWEYGFTWIGDYVNEQTIWYIVKYIHKKDVKHRYFVPDILTSSGIGAGYIGSQASRMHKFNGEDTIDYYTTSQGFKISLPIYWRNKLYTEEEREKLWLIKLDKLTRYVGGEKIDISGGMDEYYRVLEWHQAKNKQLGYGDNVKDWERIIYEKQQRELNMAKRIGIEVKQNSSMAKDLTNEYEIEFERLMNEYKNTMPPAGPTRTAGNSKDIELETSNGRLYLPFGR